MSLPNFTRQSLLQFLSQQKWFFAFLGFSALGCLIFYLGQPTKNVIDQAEPTASIDTMIPAQYVLVPLQLDNAEFLKDLINQTAVVDLFAKYNEKTQLLAQNVRIIKNPNPPLGFSALVHETRSALFFTKAQSIFAVIKNQNQTPTVVPENKKGRKIYWESL